MTLEEFLVQTQSDVQREANERTGQPGPFPHPVSLFSEIVMQHMSDFGMTNEPQVLHIERRLGNAILRLSGYAISEDLDQLDLFVSLYLAAQEPTSVPESDITGAAQQCMRFLENTVSGKLASKIDPSDEAYDLILTVRDCYDNLDQVRVFVLTDGVAKSKSYKPRDIGGKSVLLEVMDIERLYRHVSEGRPRDELVVDFVEAFGSPVPCVYVPGVSGEYDYALAAFPGAMLRTLYEKWGSRLLEANVRSFLSQTGKVNKGIRDTLRTSPDRFLAYNNGIVVVADELSIGTSPDGGTGISWLKGMQIVNGGQTTASIYFTKRKFPEVDLSQVRVPAKIIVLRSSDEASDEALISDISRFANSQNQVRVSDLSANKPFHVEMERLSSTTYCPDGVGRWFYERATGSYNVMLAREGKTPARLRDLKLAMPTSRKVTKTDLAKYAHAWRQKPHLVALGSQKNFQIFNDEAIAEGAVPDLAEFKNLMAQALLYRRAEKLIRPAFQGFQANITAYTIGVIANRLGDRIALSQIWQQQAISDAFVSLINQWSREVNDALRSSAGQRIVSEWAKKDECWEYVRSREYSKPAFPLLEMQ
ncbi:AIPR family protein [Devosia salina]|uniref:AIPR family protein n=1 Tax=Devosia salina TaxID=2860336 RepID=A0ABX8WDS6_9HYPH|nr:AIPR family protein [Devosia salina]QYO76563.1 AIPR family protein [Devosia salina]